MDFKIEIENLLHENYFGILSASPSIFLPDKFMRRKYIVETEKNIFFANCGTNIFLCI